MKGLFYVSEDFFISPIKVGVYSSRKEQHIIVADADFNSFMTRTNGNTDTGFTGHVSNPSNWRASSLVLR